MRHGYYGRKAFSLLRSLYGGGMVAFSLVSKVGDAESATPQFAADGVIHQLISRRQLGGCDHSFRSDGIYHDHELNRATHSGEDCAMRRVKTTADTLGIQIHHTIFNEHLQLNIVW